MPFVLARNWWSLVIRGLLAIAIGLAALALPGITLEVLVLLFGVYAMIDGIVNLAGVFRASGRHERWGVLLLEGVVGILAGVVTFVWPAITALVLVYVIAAWALITGALEIAAAIRLRRVIRDEWLLILSGVVSILLGIAFTLMPITGALVIALWVGLYAIIFGVLMVALGIRLRSLGRTPHPGTSIPLTSA